MKLRRAIVIFLLSVACGAAQSAAPAAAATQAGNLAAQEKLAEDHFLQRMDQELPAMMDRYLNAKTKQNGLGGAGH